MVMDPFVVSAAVSPPGMSSDILLLPVPAFKLKFDVVLDVIVPPRLMVGELNVSEPLDIVSVVPVLKARD